MTYLISFYVPETHCEAVKQALFNNGAGELGDYDSCCWQVKGEGQFRPKEGSSPFLGEKGVLEKTTEYKVEMICKDQVIKEVIDALKKSHPYEEVAYSVIKLEEF